MHLSRHHWIHRVFRVFVLVLVLVAVGGFGAGNDAFDPVTPDIVLDSADLPSSADGPDLEETMVAHIPRGSARDVARTHKRTAPPTPGDAPRAPPDRPPSAA